MEEIQLENNNILETDEEEREYLINNNNINYRLLIILNYKYETIEFKINEMRFIPKFNYSSKINHKRFKTMLKLDDKLKGQNEKLVVNSNLLQVVGLPEINDDIKKELLTILSTGEYCIPFETEFFEEFKGKIGKIKIKWTTPALKEYEQKNSTVI